METVIARYDGALCTSGGNIVQFLYGEDGMDAVWIEQQTFESLTLKISVLEDKYALRNSDPDFDKDPHHGQESYAVIPSVCTSSLKHCIFLSHCHRCTFGGLGILLHFLMWWR